MARDDSDRPGVERRTLLRQLGAGSALAIGGLQQGAAASRQSEQPGRQSERLDRQSERRPIPAGTYRPDTSHLPAVESARVVVHEGGSVSKHLSVDGERLAERRERQSGQDGDGPTVSTYSIGLELERYDRARARALSEGRPDDAGLRAVVGRRDRPVRAGGPDVGAPDTNEPGANESGSNGPGSNVPGSNRTRSNGLGSSDLAPNGTASSDARPDGVGRGRDRATPANDAAAPSKRTATSASSVASSGSTRDGLASILSHEDGIDEQPATGSRDYAAFGQTESQECGPLARTTVLSEAYTSSYGTWFYDTTADRETVSGNACAGHKWNAKFEAFCTFLGFLPGYDCAIPSAFDTDWNVYAADRRGTRSGTVFTCGNFPVIPDTVVSAHDVKLTEGDGGVGVEFDSVVGVVPYNDVGDYDFDVNGISNLIVDGLAAAFPGLDSVYSYALATYLLEHDAAVVA